LNIITVTAGVSATKVSIVALAGEATVVVSTDGIGVTVVGTCGALVDVTTFNSNSVVDPIRVITRWICTMNIIVIFTAETVVTDY